MAVESTAAAADSRLESDEYSLTISDFGAEAAAASESPSAPGAAESIAVCIRVRPLTDREERQRDVSVLRCVPKLQLISLTDAQGTPLPGKTNVFQYDHIFDAPSSTADMYARVARRIVRSTLEGINGTIFAYGQTSSGKTHTMQGPLAALAHSDAHSDAHSEAAVDLSASPGILQLAVDDIFQYIQQCEDRDFLLRVSFVEIYNEVVRDLLAPADKDASLKLREDPRKGVYVDCKEEIITDLESILQLLHAGNRRRAVGQTAMNERSSRSHSIFRIVIESKRKSGKSSKATAASSSSSARRNSDEDVNGAVLVASLSLVDLAGSESLRHTAAEGIRQREASNINKSLLTLSRVINSLASVGDPASQNAPFRDSKLTRLLQNSLGGNTRTLIVCCVTPAERYLEETRSTLQFAARAKSIQISATVNEVLDDRAQLRRLKREVHELKKLVHNERHQYKAEIDDHKVKIDHLKGLILSSASIASRAAADKELLLDGRSRARSKRSRETWCPGDFPISVKARRLGSLDGSPLSLKRLSADSKQSRLSSDAEDFHDSDRQLPDSSRSSLQGDAGTQAHHRWIQLLTQTLHHPDDEETSRLWKSMASASGVESGDEIVKLQSELQSVVGASMPEENKRLRWRIEELEAAHSRQPADVGDGPTKSPKELTRQLEACQEALAREQERRQALVEDQARSEEAMAAERNELMQHLETLQSAVADKEVQWGVEKQQLQMSLEEVLAEVGEFRARLTRTAGGDAASAVQELAKVKRQLKKTQMELARAREEQQRREELHREALADVEAASKGSVEEYSQQLEDAIAEIDELKLVKTQVVEQLEAAFDNKAKELTAQLEAAQEAARALEQELAALSSAKDDAADRSSELEQLVVEKQALADAKAGLEEQLERMTSRQSRLEQQVKALGEDNSELTENVEELECRVGALTKENQELQARHDAAPAATGLEDVSGELKEVLSELVQLRATIDATEREKEDVADQNELLAGELGDVKSLLVEREHQVKVLHAQLDAKVMTISQLADRHAEAVAALQQQAERLQMQQQDVRLADAGGLKGELKAERREFEALEEEEEEEAAKYATFKEESEADVLPTQAEAADEQDESMAIVDPVAERDQLNAQARAAVAALEQKLADAAAQHDEMVEELRALEAQLMLESQEKLQLAVSADEQRVKLLEAEDKLRQVDAELTESLARQEEVDAASRQLGEELERLRAASTPPAAVGGDEVLRRQLEAEQQARRRFELDVKSYEETLALLRRELTEGSHAAAAQEERLRALERELAAAASRQQAAEKELKRLSTALERNGEEKAEMQRQMKQRLVAAETRELALEEQLERLQRGSAGDAMQLQAQDLVRAKEFAADLEQQLTSARNALSKRELELQHTRLELQQRVDESEEREHEQSEQVAALEMRVEEQAARVADAEKQWTQQAAERARQAAEEVDGLREQLHEVQEELERVQQFADAEVRRLRARHEQVEAELAQAAASHEARELELLRRVDEDEHELAQLRASAATASAVADDSQRTDEQDELREALRASELEARHYHGQLVAAQLAQERAEERVEAQRARIDKLEKVKMTNETLEVFRKLKSDRQVLQAQLKAAQTQALASRPGSSGRGSEAAVRELRDALRAEKQRVNDLRAALRDEQEKSSAEVDAMRELLRDKMATAEGLARKVKQLELERRGEQPDAASASELERENLELQFENRRLRSRLTGNQESVADDKENEPTAIARGEGEPKARGRHPALPPSVQDLRRQVDAKEKDQDARQQCRQQ